MQLAYPRDVSPRTALLYQMPAGISLTIRHYMYGCVRATAGGPFITLGSPEKDNSHMKKVDEVLPFFKNEASQKSGSKFAKLRNSKGKVVKEFISKCEDGLSPEEFDSLAEKKVFEKVLAALHKQKPDISIPMQVFALKSFANTNRLLKKLDGTIPWEAYVKRYPCLELPKMVSEECANNKHCLSCMTFHRRTYYHLIEMLLVRHEILSEENGIFADRLMTAIELGVPFSRIENYMGSTLGAAIAVLKKHFPYTNRDFLSQCANEYLESWHRLSASSGKSTSDSVAAVKN